MKKRNLSLLLVSAALMAACGTPQPNTMLDEARTEYQRLQTSTQAATVAPLEFKAATDALNRAESAWKDKEDTEEVNQLAYLAKRSVSVAELSAKQKAAEQIIANASTERDRVRLEARTAEADRAKLQAQQAEQQTQQAQQQTSAAQQEAAILQQQAQTAQQQAEEAKAKMAEMEKQLQTLQAKKTERGTVVTLGDVVFDTGKATLRSGSRRTLEKLANALKQNPNSKIMIEGFTDSVGSDESNQSLSERRAEAVKNALVDLGVNDANVTTRGYGEGYPVANNKTAAGRQMNRRVEIIISNDQNEVAPRTEQNGSASE